MSVAQVQYHCDRCDTGALLDFITKSGLREERGHIYIPKGFKENAALTMAINYLCNEFDFSAGEQPETEVALDFVRASGDCICDQCGKKYYDHPRDGPEHDGHKWLHRICSGRLVKL